MRKRLVIASAIALVVLLACAPPADRSGATDGAETAGSLPRYLSVGTAPPGGAFYVVGGAIAATVEEAESGHGWQVTAEATKGSQENIRRLTRGELDFALANSAISYFAARGEGGWEEAHEIRAVMTLAPNVALFVTPEGSGISTVADLRGRRVVLGPAGAGFHYFLRPILEAHGVRYEEVDALHATQAGAVDLLSDGSAAAAFLGGAVPTASIVQVAAGRDIVYIPFEPMARETLLATYSFFRPATLPAGTYRGQDEDFIGLDVGSMHLISSLAADEALVYLVTRAIYEGRDKVTERHPAGRAIRDPNVVRDTGIPFHPGAIRYYEEIGIWPSGDQEEGSSP